MQRLCKTTKQFTKDIKEISPNIEVLGEYTGMRDKILVRCTVCGREWYPKAGNLMNGCNCISCLQTRENWTQEQFVDRLYDINPKLLPLDEFKNLSTPINVKCLECNTQFLITPKRLLAGKCCCDCVDNTKATLKNRTNKFLERCSVINPSLTVVGKYVSSRTPITVQCKECGYEFERRPLNLVKYRQSCPSCGVENRRIIHENIEEALKKHVPTIKALEPCYSWNKLYTFKCEVCKKNLTLTPTNLLKYRCCPECKRDEMVIAKRKNKRKQNDYDIMEKYRDYARKGHYIEIH